MEVGTLFDQNGSSPQPCQTFDPGLWSGDEQSVLDAWFEAGCSPVVA
jgi:hypothetical protein